MYERTRRMSRVGSGRGPRCYRRSAEKLRVSACKTSTARSGLLVGRSYPMSQRQTTGFWLHAALISGSDPEQGRPFSWTQPGGIAGHGVPSGLTHAWSIGVADAVAPVVNSIPRATAAAAQRSWL